ncbi:MAG: FecR domain-containing protein, partial [Myxococcales bacterium]|nr:FecR domain-containing protein [Myxococcales bacterium]
MSSRRPATIALLSALLFASPGCTDLPPPAPTVALARVVRGSVSIESGEHQRSTHVSSRVESAAKLEVSAQGSATLALDLGAWMLLDGGAAIEPELESVRVSAGRVWIDASRTEGLRLRTPQGELVASGSRFALEVRPDESRVYCSHGEISYRTERGDGTLARGETLILGEGEPEVQPALLWEDWTGGLADPAPLRPARRAYVGSLAGRGVGLTGSAHAPLPVRAHQVEVSIEGELAITSVEQTFFNAQ